MIRAAILSFSKPTKPVAIFTRVVSLSAAQVPLLAIMAVPAANIDQLWTTVVAVVPLTVLPPFCAIPVSVPHIEANASVVEGTFAVILGTPSAAVLTSKLSRTIQLVPIWT